MRKVKAALAWTTDIGWDFGLGLHVGGRGDSGQGQMKAGKVGNEGQRRGERVGGLLKIPSPGS